MVDPMLMHPQRRGRIRLFAKASAPHRRAIIVALSTIIGVGGCGESTVTQRAAVLHLKVGEYDISPESVETYAGTIRLEVKNDGVLAHQVAVADAAGGGLYLQTATVFPGHTTLTAPFKITPGRYRLFDPGANYADLGAYGTLTVLAR
jgi:hypothetical protein